jgi:hypothetical protein
VRRAYHRLVHRADWIVTAVIQSATFAALIDPFNRILLVALPWLALPALLLPNLMRVGHDELACGMCRALLSTGEQRAASREVSLWWHHKVNRWLLSTPLESVIWLMWWVPLYAVTAFPLTCMAVISVTATLLIVSNIAEARHFELTPWCPACRHSEDGEDGGPAPDDDPLLIPDWWRELSRR